MVNSEDIKDFVEGTLKPLSKGTKEEVEKNGKVVSDKTTIILTDRVPGGNEKYVEIIPAGEELPESVVKELREKGSKVSGKEAKVKEVKEKKKVVNEIEEKNEVDKEVKEKKVKKKDKVLKALAGIPENSVDLLFFDPFNRLGGKEMEFKTPSDRDKYIERVQGWLTEAYKKLNPKGGNMVIGASVFTLTSFGDGLFPTADVKRMLSWYRETERGELGLDRGYVPAVVPFLWGVRGRPWTFNLQGEEKFFDGEFKVSGGKVNDPLKMAQQVVRRFSNEGDTVLELFGSKTVIAEAVESEGRNYVSGYVTT